MVAKQYLINQRIGWRYIGSEAVLFNCNNQKILVWNDTASLLWKKMTEGINLDELINFLASEYSISYIEAKKDILSFFQEAKIYGFIDFDSEDLEKIDYGNSQSEEDRGGERALLEIEMKSIENLVPFSITFETTYDCNENCIHCYMGHGQNFLSFLY